MIYLEAYVQALSKMFFTFSALSMVYFAYRGYSEATCVLYLSFACALAGPVRVLIDNKEKV